MRSSTSLLIKKIMYVCAVEEWKLRLVLHTLSSPSKCFHILSEAKSPRPYHLGHHSQTVSLGDSVPGPHTCKARAVHATYSDL